MFPRAFLTIFTSITLLSNCKIVFGTKIHHLAKLKQLYPRNTLKSTSLKMSTTCIDSLALCQVDAYAKSSTNRILNFSNNSDGSCTVVLDDSVLYPEGGGQPCDFGFVNKVSILDVSKVPGPGTQVQVKLSEPLTVNVGDEVNCEVDWDRRYDFMQQHTAQHLFSAVAEKLFNAETVGWGLGKDTVTVDLQTSPLLTGAQLDEIENQVNEEIRKGSLVTWSLHHREELERLSILRGAPKGAAQDLDQLRLVTIDGIDMNPCGGTHLKSVGEIQCLKILGYEKDRNAIRVRWVAGSRAVRYFKACVDREATTMSLLCAHPDTHFSHIEKLLKDKRDNMKLSKSMNEELTALLASSMSGYLSTIISDPTMNYLVYHRPTGDLNFISNLAEIISASYPDTILYFSVSSSDSANPVSEKKKGKGPAPIQAPAYNVPYTLSASTSGSFILFGPKDKVEMMKADVMAALNARGGGRPGRAQGTANNLEHIELVREIIIRSLK